MQEIDRVAMAESAVGTDEYLARWQWGPELTREGSAEQVAAAVAAELEAQWETMRRR